MDLLRYNVTSIPLRTDGALITITITAFVKYFAGFQIQI
jgi:hypothetical protein